MAEKTTVSVTLRLRPPLQELDHDGASSPDSETDLSDAATTSATSTASAPIAPYTGAGSLKTPPAKPPRKQQQFPPDIDVASEPRHAAFHGRKFRFTHTFGPDADTPSIFAEQRDAILGVLKGFDATVMCYGSTGAGKTHTMVGTAESPGLMPLALDALFERIGAASSSSSEYSYALQVSALELLEERCVDLLHNRAAVVLRAGSSKGLGAGLVFSGLKEVAVTTKAQLLALIESAMQARTTAANYRHEHSSRSHFAVRLRIDGARLVTLGPPATIAAAAAAAPAAEGNADADAIADAGASDDADADPALGSTVTSVRDATSAVLTLVDLAGSEAAMQNTTAAAVSQGVTINKSLHWLKVAVHELAAKRNPTMLRNSALTRLLAPSLSGGAHVSIVVCSPVSPAPSACRDALETLAFGETAGRVTLQPTRRTEVSGGQLGKLQALLVQMSDDKSALATDAAALREQVDGYEMMITELRAGFVSRDSLADAERLARTAEEELASANARNDELARRVAEEESERARLAAQLQDVEAQAAAAHERNAALVKATREAADERAALEARLSGARTQLSDVQGAAEAREAELDAQRAAVSSLMSQVLVLEEQLTAEREASARRDAEAQALAESNSALEERVRNANEAKQAKEQLLLLRHKMYTASRRRPNSAAASPRAGSTTPGGTVVANTPSRPQTAMSSPEAFV